MPDILPPNTLPGVAKDWGRSIAARTADTEKRQNAQQQQIDNNARLNAGQMSMISSQVNELTERNIRVNRMYTSGVAGITASGDPIPMYWSNYIFTITQPRIALLDAVISVSMTTSGTGAYEVTNILGYETQRTLSPNSPDPGGIGLANLEGEAQVASTTYARSAAGTSSGGISGMSYFRLLPGTYSIWAGAQMYRTGGGAASIASNTVCYPGVTNLILSAPDRTISSSDIPPYAGYVGP